ncbi:MAG: Gfo/Idh/MocA family protein [Phycisphaeraceae bacterium]
MKVGVLGTGGMGNGVIRRLQENERVEQVLAHDRDPQRLRQTCEQRGVEGSLDLDELLRDPALELVFVTASNEGHYELTMRAIEAGKAVMCEKPIATTLSDARRMVDAAEASGCFLQIGFELRYSKLYTRVQEWIDQGLLGKVVNTHCLYTVCEYWGSDSWRVLREPSGGMFGEKLSHYVDLPRWWIGDRVTQVHSVCAPNIIPYFEVHDNYHTTYRFANGAASHLTFMMGPAATFRGDPLQNVVDQQEGDGHVLRYRVVGTKGAAEASVFERSIKRWAFDVAPKHFDAELAEQVTWPAEEDHYYFHNTTDQAHDIVRRVAEGLPPKTSARDAYETMKLSFAAEYSADAQEPVEVDELESSLLSSSR